MEIKKIKAREVLDSRGNPTVEVEVYTEEGMGRAIVPSGASTGEYEALELRDKDDRFHGKGVQKACANVQEIAKELIGMDVTAQKEIDKKMLELDGTDNKSKYGANALLGISMAVARAAADSKKIPLYKYLGNDSKRLPIPFCNIINGGKHAGGKLEMQEFMIAPIKAESFKEAARMASEIYQTLKGILKKKYGASAVNVGDEGGFAPPIDKAEDALDLITQAIKESGYEGKVKIAMDPAASEFYHDKTYLREKLPREEIIAYYNKLSDEYPIISIEDPFDQDDFESYEGIMKDTKIQIVGDDLLVTNTKRIQMALDKGLCNALLLKVNQIGTLTEAMDAAKLAMDNDWHVMVSHRSGETEDPFIADLAVALGTGQIKLGAPCRADRTAKFNQLIRIEDELGEEAIYPDDMFE
ncbi:MAG: phosphopyruvate hydratase [Candidatus Woesearchaeota archaeon]